VFLRNLKLLRITDQPDWPGLLSFHFSGGQQAQQIRIKGVEWALYHLFAIWDPEVARNVGSICLACENLAIDQE
jgi:hypothetical protein